jgi:hypothetical protein
MLYTQLGCNILGLIGSYTPCSEFWQPSATDNSDGIESDKVMSAPARSRRPVVLTFALLPTAYQDAGSPMQTKLADKSK